MPVNKSDVAMRAYQIWQSEGCPHGRDLDHWLQAEAELAVKPVRKRVSAAGRSRKVKSTAKRPRIR